MARLLSKIMQKMNIKFVLNWTTGDFKAIKEWNEARDYEQPTAVYSIELMTRDRDDIRILAHCIYYSKSMWK